MRALLAEAIGTFVLVASICGAAMISFDGTVSGAGLIGIAMSAGLAFAAMGFALGPVSGAHFNPAITLGLLVAGRFKASRVAPYLLVQTIGGIAGAFTVFFVLTYKVNWTPGGFASNGFGEHSPGGYGLPAVLASEIVLSAILVLIYCRVTRGTSMTKVLAPLAMGLALTMLHLVSLPVSFASFNPARSTATAMFAETWALQQLWVFWVAPVAGGCLGGIIDRYFGDVS